MRQDLKMIQENEIFILSKIKEQNSFTLIELIVVIAIIAILAAVVAPNAFKAIEKAKIAKCGSDLQVMKKAALIHYADTGLWGEGEKLVDSHWVPKNWCVKVTQPSVDIVDENFGMNCVEWKESFFLIDTGELGWDGPYIDKEFGFNPWSDRYTYLTRTGAPLFSIYTNYSDFLRPGVRMANIVVSDLELQVKLDFMIDDGNLMTGQLRNYDRIFLPEGDYTEQFGALGQNTNLGFIISLDLPMSK